jgi:hypothetical protein
MKFSNAGSAVAGVAKTIFPGLFISILGGSFAFWMFNNPEKIRGKATLRAWESLKQYERLYFDNTDQINCGNFSGGMERFKNNMLHQIHMTSENLKTVLDKENNVDNLMLAILNMRIDTYNEIKKLTDTLFETLNVMYSFNAPEIDITNRWIAMHTTYMDECAYINNRDTSTINKILKELRQVYSIKLTEDKFLPDSTELRKKIIGKWQIALYNVTIDLKTDGTAFWNGLQGNQPSTWQLDSTVVKIKYNDGTIKYDLALKRVTDDILSLSQIGGTKETSYIACRIK